jgi:hypothetical protein
MHQAAEKLREGLVAAGWNLRAFPISDLSFFAAGPADSNL